MGYLKLTRDMNQIQKEIKDDLQKIVFPNQSTKKNSSAQIEFTSSLNSLISELFQNHQLSPLVDFLQPHLTDKEDSIRFEVFNLFCFLSQLKKDSNQASFPVLMELIDQKSFFEDANVAIKAFGILLNLEKTDKAHRLVVFERLFRFAKANNSTVLYKYSFDLPNTIGAVSRELHLEILEDALKISQMKSLWEDLGKLLLIQAGLFAESEALPESVKEKLSGHLLTLMGSIKGIFFLKNLETDSQIKQIIDSNQKISNLIEALRSGDCTKLSEENNAKQNQEKARVVKLMNLVEKKCNWGLAELSQEIYEDSERSSQKKVQGLLMKCMKQNLLRAKINCKNNSVVVT